MPVTTPTNHKGSLSHLKTCLHRRSFPGGCGFLVRGESGEVGDGGWCAFLMVECHTQGHGLE